MSEQRGNVDNVATAVLILAAAVWLAGTYVGCALYAVSGAIR